MKLKAMREGTPTAEDIAAAYRAAREELGRRRERYLEKGAERVEKRVRGLERGARAASWQARRDLAERIHPRRRGRFMVLLFGVGIGAAIGYSLADSRNRQRLSEYSRILAERARPVVEGAGARLGVGSALRGGEEAAILVQAEAAVADTPAAGSLRVAVEGRTVYLRGQAPPELSQDLAERLRSLTGVAAVVNLTMAPAPAGNAEKAASPSPAPASGPA